MLRPGSLIARTLALAILMLVVLIAYQMIVRPLLNTYAETRDEIARSSELLQRYRTLASAQSTLSERLATIKENDEIAPGYLKGASDALAAAELQELAAEMIEASGGVIKSTQILQATAVEDGPASIRRTGLKLRFAATIDGLATALYDLETAEPHLFIDELAVSTQRNVSNNRSESDVALDVRIDIFGYSREPSETTPSLE